MGSNNTIQSRWGFFFFRVRPLLKAYRIGRPSLVAYVGVRGIFDVICFHYPFEIFSIQKIDFG
jgi:hypothetical protein